MYPTSQHDRSYSARIPPEIIEQLYNTMLIIYSLQNKSGCVKTAIKWIFYYLIETAKWISFLLMNAVNQNFYNAHSVLKTIIHSKENFPVELT